MSHVVERAARMARTVAHLRPEQVVHRARLRAQQRLIATRPEPFVARWRKAPDRRPPWPSSFRALDAVVRPDTGPRHELMTGTFTFLNERRALGDPPTWDPPDATDLWLFHHHYWEWAWTLAAEPGADATAAFARQWRSWRDQTSFGRPHAWAAYPASLRAWVLVNVFDTLVAGTDLEAELVADLALHGRFLARHLELDVGGNHLIKDLKALVGLGVFLGDQALLDLARKHLCRQLVVQVLPDGGHFELSPSYHCQVLGDLIDVAGLLSAAGATPVVGLADVITRMRRWLGLVLLPDGDVPAFNDGERVGPARLAALRPGPAPSGPLTVLADSGYVVVRPDERLHLVVDVGAPGPDDHPGHAHADCLGFELCVDGRRVVVDPGTSRYGTGPRRSWERGTRSHSTVEVDETDQTEVWGAFRVGRLARATLERAEVSADGIIVIASHDGYRHLPGSPVHRRRWEVTQTQVRILDEITGTGRHDLRHHLLFAGATPPGGTTGGPPDPSLAPVAVDGPPGADTRWEDTEYAIGFGRRLPARSLVTTVRADLPTSFAATLAVTAGGPPPAVPTRP